MSRRTLYLLVEGDTHHAYENIQAFPTPKALLDFLRDENVRRVADKKSPWKAPKDDPQKWTDGTFLRWVEEVPFED